MVGIAVWSAGIALRRPPLADAGAGGTGLLVR
jgi:hypothetical protein